ncbi:MAG: motility protein A [Desulfovibrionaceae bacterium]|jgi:chemotaxis protein MotA
MDIATIIGLVLGLGLIVGAILMGGGLGGFIDAPSILVVVGGTIASAFIMFPMNVVIGTIKVIMKTIFFQARDPRKIISKIIELAETARKESLVALEKVSVDDEFLKKGVQMVADGTDETLVRQVLETEIKFMKQRHLQGQGVMKGMGTMAPAFGMIGTLIGLVNMLGNLSDPSSIGPAMAVALLTTFYGAVLANVVFLPLAKKLEGRSEEDQLYMEIMLEGVISIQRGDHPAVLKEKLQSFLAPAIREKSA